MAPHKGISPGTVAVTIVLLGAFLYVRDTIQTFGTGVLSQIEIAVYLKGGVDDVKAQELASQLASDPRVLSATYVSKAAGLRRMQDVLGHDFDTSLLTSNPLPNTYHVKVKDPDTVPAVAATIARDPLVAKTDYAADTVQKLLKVATIFGRAGIVLIALHPFSAPRLTQGSRARKPSWHSGGTNSAECPAI